MAPPHEFTSKPSDEVRRRLSSIVSGKRPSVVAYTSLTPMWAGIAGTVINNQTEFEVAISIHDSVYNTDFASSIVKYDVNDPEAQAAVIEEHVLQTIRSFSSEHLCKFLGAGVTLSLLREAPNLCTRLWLELDIVPIVFNIKPFHTDSITRPNIKHRISSTTGSYVPSGAETPTVYYDPSQVQGTKLGASVGTRLPIPRTVDEQADSAARKCIMYFGPGNNPRLMIGPRNQVAVDSGGKIHLVDDIDEYRKTVHGGTWRTVNKLADELREKKIKMAFFSSTPQGDDPQMPGLIPLIKKVRPDLPIIYRSHIEIRSDLVHIEGSPQEEVWKYLWNNIQHADMFISHPVNKFVPSDVPGEKLALLGAATDWLDGLNKDLHPWDSGFYMGEFRSLCARDKMTELKWPERDYILQIARFDPSKGIPNVIDSFCRFRKLLEAEDDYDPDDTPQMLICGHGAVDDPDASIIYDQTINLIHTKYPEYAKDFVVMRCPPSDQLLNALMANSKFALQLSTREGFEVKVSEALHAGKPVVAFRTGGIPLQIVDDKSGYLCDVGDNETVAKHMFDLYTDEALYRKVSEYARTHVSDEVSTVGNSIAWMYLAVMHVSRGVKLRPKGAWLNDLARNEVGEPYEDGEPKLPRGGLNVQG
ncbi:unnamed protein product [Somion occarium]|uniref:Glycosyl transferase family 1 domain-containing protein n=1 Tax=Somion occarium TaxID=3059160 RepID=A0ABP1D7A0_9APHY